MLAALRGHLPGLTVFSLGFGLIVGFALAKVAISGKLTEDAFIREVERGARMHIIVRSGNLSHLVADRRNLVSNIEHGPLILKGVEITIPDEDAEELLGCQGPDDGFFAADVERRTEISVIPEQGSTVSGTTAPMGKRSTSLINTSGVLSACTVDAGRAGLLKTEIARGISATICLESGTTFTSVSAVATYFDFLGKMFINFLLMLFIPTLALALVRAVLDSAGALRRFGPAFVFFAVSSTSASAIGVLCGLALSQVRSGLDSERMKDLAHSFGGRTEIASYDPHPLLTQLRAIIPTNPVGALSDPAGNSGLQIAFVSILLGAVLASLGEDTRRVISNSLKRTFSVIVKDHELKNGAISDYAEWAGPAGVFFLAVSTGSKMDMGALQDLGSLCAAVILGLACFAALSLVWLRFFRDWHSWYATGFKPALPGLVTAFATSSSYSALPQVNAIPIVSGDSLKRGVLGFGITLNKSGTALYIGAAASFMLGRLTTPDPLAFMLMILLCGMCNTACAGLPFAAVFALHMLLGASGALAGLAWFILPIDPILDRFVTAVNVFTNICACSSPRQSQRMEPRNTEPLALGARGD